VNGLSDYVRVDAGMNAPDASTVDLGAMLGKLLAEAQRRGRRLGSAALPEPLLVHADPRHVEQIVRSLVTDAMAVDPQATGRLSATSVDGRVVVELLLTTARVAPEDLRQLLDPFGGDDASRPLDESRLRLALARGFAEANGGQLRLQQDNPDEVAFVLELHAAPAPVAS
jgi:two-component system sensor histidine kinase KdpD